MKRIALHWQILFALVIAIIYGLIFSNQYKLKDSSFSDLTPVHITETGKQVNLEDVKTKLVSISGKKFSTKIAFQSALKAKLNQNEYEVYARKITRQSVYNPAISSVSWMGDLFLRGLKMLVIPLILFSILSGIVNMERGSNLGRLGLKTIVYYLSTSTLAILGGIILVNIFQPGKGMDVSSVELVEEIPASQQSLRDILIEIVPDNIFKALVDNYLLSIIFFSILAGIFITKLPDEHRDTLVKIINASFELFMKITMFLILLAPLGIFGLVAKVVADQSDFLNLLLKLGKFTLCVLLAIFIHAFVVMPLIVKIIGKSNPFKHFGNMSAAILTAFSTTSSAATLPVTLENIEEKSGVSKRVANFTLPIGATVNMDGTAIYICVVVFFIAQAYGIELGFKEQFLVLITALLTSIGTAAIPMASLVIITIILTALGLPLEGIALVLPVDRVLDMFRTATNVWSDSCGAVVIAKSEGETLKV